MMMFAGFLLSILGWHVYLARRTRLPMSVAPLLLVAVVVMAEYAAGFLNAIRPLQGVLLSGGLVMGIWACVRPPIVRRMAFDYIPQVFLTLAMLLVSWMMQGAVVVDFDDFSHWYRICKIIYADGGLPKAPDLLFRSYVPGAALWVSFVTRFVSFSPSACFAAHRAIGLMAICVFFLPFEMHARKTWTRALLSFGLLAGLAVVSGSLREGIYNLLVDKTVALVAAAVFFMLACGWRRSDLSVPVLLSLLLLALLKCSALMFAGILGFVAAAAWWWNSATWRQRLFAVLPVILPLVLFASYVIYIRLHFPGHHGMGSHAFPNIPAWIDRVTWLGEVIGPLTRRFVSALVAFPVREVRICLGGIVLASFGLFLDRERKWLGLILAIAVCWIIGMYLTYVLEMTPSEIDGLASFNRYLGTLALFMIPTLFLCLAGNGRLNVAVLIVGAAVVACGGSYGYLGGCRSFQSQGVCSTALWRCLESSFPENLSYVGGEYAVVYDDSLLGRATDTPDRLRNGCSLWLRTQPSNIWLLRESEVQSSASLADQLKGCACVLRLGMSKEE